MKQTLLTILAISSLGLSAPAATIITQWDFNDNPSDEVATTGTLVPSIGSGTAVTVGTVATTYNLADGSSDPLGSSANNSAWRMSGNWPAQGTGNKTCGVQLNLSTVGYENITLAWDHANSTGANKYYRVQYSIDNGATWVDKDVVINSLTVNAFTNPIATVSFVSIPGANNNPNLGVRIVSELQSTAVGGSPVYVAISGGSYGVGGVLRLDMITFRGDVATGEVNILTDPTSQIVAAGQPASFEVIAGGGVSTITYQWRKDTVPLPDGTNSVYAIAAAQHIHAGAYDVIVSNAVNARTSAVATLTVRDPRTLAWTGQNGNTWDGLAANWVDTATQANVPYSGGDHVLFNNLGAGSPLIDLVGSLNPSSVTVDGDSDYVLSSNAGGKITGTAGLTKRGNGRLTLNTDNAYSGPTVIETGIVQVGNADTHGSLGTGPVTNHGALVFNRTDNIVLLNRILSAGGVTNYGKTVTFLGTNVFNAPVHAAAGAIELSGNQAVNSDIVIAASSATGVGGATKVGFNGGMAAGPGTTIYMTGSTAAPDCRTTFQSTTGTNVFNGPIVVDGSGANNLSADGSGVQFTINGNISASSSGFGGSLFLRGNNGVGILNGTVNLPGNVVNKTDSSTWLINSTSNAWVATTLAVGTLRLGAHNALPTGITLSIGQTGAAAILDLAGFNQQLAVLADSPGSTGTAFITNSSATTDSTLTVGSGGFSGCIADSAAGRKTSLTVNGTAFSLAAVNTYSGDTTVAAGVLSLSGAGDIPNSAAINLAGGSVNVSGRSDGTLAIRPGQTLKGNGTFTVTGNLVNNGTLELKVNRTGGVISNDKVAVTGQLTPGGTLKLVLSGQGLTREDTIQIASAGSWGAGMFHTIEPAVPGSGLTWNTSTLATDGILRIDGQAAPSIGSTTLSAAGDALIFSGTGGTPNGPFTVLSSTNVAAPIAEWAAGQSGAFDSNGNFRVTNSILPGTPRDFFRVRVP